MSARPGALSRNRFERERERDISLAGRVRADRDVVGVVQSVCSRANTPQVRRVKSFLISPSFQQEIIDSL